MMFISTCADIYQHINDAMCNGDSVELFWGNKKIALPGKRLACLGLQRWKPVHAYIRWSSYPHSSYLQGSDQHVNDSVCNGDNAELFPNSHNINFPIALNLAGGYHEYFDSNVWISQKFKITILSSGYSLSLLALLLALMVYLSLR